MKQYLATLREVGWDSSRTVKARSFKNIEDTLNFSVESVKQITDDEEIIEFVVDSFVKSSTIISFSTEDDKEWEVEICEVEVE